VFYFSLDEGTFYFLLHYPVGKKTS